MRPLERILVSCGLTPDLSRFTDRAGRLICRITVFAPERGRRERPSGRPDRTNESRGESRSIEPVLLLPDGAGDEQADQCDDRRRWRGLIAVCNRPPLINQLQHLAIDQSRLKDPLLFGFDVIHGLHTIFPVPLGMAASWDPSLVEQAQGTAAAEARAVGIHWAFAPMLDIARDPRWGRMVEGAGEDPYIGSAMAAAQVRGFQGAYLGSPGHFIAGPKHFVGYGAALGGRDYDEVNLSDSELWNVYLPPFKAAVDASAVNIMSAYMAINGVPASANQWLLTKVLRDTWGFKGFVVSDSSAVLSLKTQGLAVDAQEAAVRALKAGLDMEMTPPIATPAMKAIPAALQANKLSVAELDRAVRYVLAAKIRMGLFESPYVDEKCATAIEEDPEHLKLAPVAGERAYFTLKPEDLRYWSAASGAWVGGDSSAEFVGHFEVEAGLHSP